MASHRLYHWFAGSGYTVEPVYTPLGTIQTLSKNRLSSSFALVSANINSLFEEKMYAGTLK